MFSEIAATANDIDSSLRTAPIFERLLERLIEDETILPIQLPFIPGSEHRTMPVPVGPFGLLCASFADGYSEAVMRLPIVQETDSTEAKDWARSQRKIKREAIEWVLTDREMLSFEWYCEHLGLDTELTRKAILREVEESLKADESDRGAK